MDDGEAIATLEATLANSQTLLADIEGMDLHFLRPRLVLSRPGFPASLS